MTPTPASLDFALSADDRVLLHAIAMAGDSVREADVAYLLERWPWASPMDWDRVADLEEAGLLQQTKDGWFVPLAVDLEAAAELPKSLDPLLKGLVGEMLCRHADSFDRFQLGFRRMVAGGREQAIVAATRVWASTPAAQDAPRGERFVAALGAKRLGPTLCAELSQAVPEIAPPSPWTAPFRALSARLQAQPMYARTAAAAAAASFVLLDLVGQSAPVLNELDRR
ncbi:MAG: hypothetical protein IPJ78_01315 [Gemmatimonadetes bacterium]|nr:hypothetical protein [Gemmatimonadota bacterium]